MLTDRVCSGVGISSFWRDAADDEAVFDFHTRATAAIKTAADAKGLSYNFLYINDAHPVQEPFQYYGKGRLLPRMRHLAKKYGSSSLALQIDAVHSDPAVRSLGRVSDFESGHLEAVLSQRCRNRPPGRRIVRVIRRWSKRSEWTGRMRIYIANHLELEIFSRVNTHV